MDPHTGFIRFGFRDYDPTTGRFTARDPLGDTGGDHDLYDYCVDDPVSMNDPSGLFPPALLLLAGMAGSAGIGLGGAYGAAKIVDAIKELQEGKESSVARDAIKTVAPHAVDIHTKAFLPGQIGLGGVTTGVGRVLATKSAIEVLKNGRSDSRRSKD